jgi:hypothetical protein
MSIVSAVLLGVLGAGMGLAVPVSPAAAAEDVWSPTVDLSASGSGANDPQVGVDASGRAISVWERNGVIQTRSSNDGGVTWSAVVDLSAAADSSDSPRITVEASGRAIAAWRSQLGIGDFAIQVRLSSDGGATWSNTVTLTKWSRFLRNPRVSINSSGEAIAVWVASKSRNVTAIQTSSSSDMGVSWSTPADLTVISDDASKPQVTIDSSGRAIALWEGLVGNRSVVLTKSSLDGGLNWSAATNLSGTDAGGSVYKQRLSIDGSGRAIAIWGRDDKIQSSSSSDGGASWSPLVSLSSVGGYAEAPEVSIDASGRAIAIWSRYTDGGPKSTIQSSSSLDGGLTWSPAKDVSSSEFDAYDPEVSIDGSGRAIAVWESERYVPGPLNVSIMQASVSTDGGLTWSPVVDLSTADDYAYFAQLNANSSGRVFVVWELYDNLTGEDVVQTRSYLFPAALADTGANDSVMGASVMATAGLLAAGTLALAMRRRLARS